MSVSLPSFEIGMTLREARSHVIAGIVMTVSERTMALRPCTLTVRFVSREHGDVRNANLRVNEPVSLTDALKQIRAVAPAATETGSAGLTCVMLLSPPIASTELIVCAASPRLLYSMHACAE